MAPFMGAQQVRILNEQFKKDETFFRVYESYRANYNKDVLSLKFYARHDDSDLSAADPEIIKRITHARDAAPREKYPWPVTEQHEYGWWMKDRMMNVLNCRFKADERFYAARHSDPMVEHETTLKGTLIFKKKPFVGTPFILN